jgi:hypothetical protein
MEVYMDMPTDRLTGMRPGYVTPKPFDVTPTVNRKLRFIVAAAVASQAFTVPNLLDLLCMTVANNSAYRIARAVRLKYVEIWEPFNGVGVITNVGLRWDVPTTGNIGPINSTTLYASSSGPDYPAHLLARPPSGSYQDWWHNAGDSGPLLTMFSLNAGCIVDISYDYVTYESGNSTAVTTAVTTGANFPGYNAIHFPNTNITALGLFDI